MVIFFFCSLLLSTRRANCSDPGRLHLRRTLLKFYMHVFFSTPKPKAGRELLWSLVIRRLSTISLNNISSWTDEPFLTKNMAARGKSLYSLYRKF